MFKKYLTTFDSYVIYTSSVVGLGLIVLPALAAKMVGSWSILIWLMLGVLSYPMARTMGNLGARHPSSGGVTHFIRIAFGKNAGDLTGILYLLALCIGPVAAALFFAEYVAIIFPLSRNQQTCAAAIFLLALVAVNLFDVRSTMKFQRWIFMLFLGFVTLAIVLAVPHVRLDNFSFQPRSPRQLELAAFICFYAFIGWEHAAFSSDELLDTWSLVKSIFYAVLTVTLLFSMTAFVLIGVLPAHALVNGNTVISDLFMYSFGPLASKVSALAVLILFFSMMLSWVRGGGRLVHSLAVEGILLDRLARVNPKTGSPENGLLLLAGVWMLALITYLCFSLTVDDYVRLSNANYIITYLMVFLAAIKLERRSPLMLSHALVSLGAILCICFFSYQDFWYPGIICAGFVVLQAVLGRRVGKVAPSSEG